MARPSLADSLRASLNKGAHVETAEKIARGFSDVPNDLDILPIPLEPILPEPLLISPSVISEQITSSSITKDIPIQSIQLKIEEASIPSAPIPSDSQTVEPPDSQTAKQSYSYTVAPSNSPTVIPSIKQTVRQAQPQTVSQYQTNYQTPMQYVPLEVLNLAYNQACVLEALIANTSGVTNYRAISESTHVGIPSVREALSRLVVKGFMHKPVTVKNAAFQGFSFVLNKVLCDHFITAGGLSQENYNNRQTIHQAVGPSDGSTVAQIDSQTSYSSSRSLEDLKPTTTFNPQTLPLSDHQTVTVSDTQTITPSNGVVNKPTEGFILTGAIGAYWEEEGLGEGQAQKWCKQFEVLPEQMRQQLDWARFDLEINGRRAEVKKDTISWFFGHLRTTGGCFPRPVNYKSPVELRAEAIERDLAQEREAKVRLAAAEIEQKFQRILADPKSEEYQSLYSQVNNFAKEEKGMILEHALRDAFIGEGRAFNSLSTPSYSQTV